MCGVDVPRTGAVTTTALDRRPIVDGDFARAAALDRRPIVDRATSHLVWVSISVGRGYYIGDAEPAYWPAEDHWITGELAGLFHIPERNIVVRILPTPSATVKPCWLAAYLSSAVHDRQPLRWCRVVLLDW